MTLTIHQATEKDIVDIASIHVAGWQGAYGGLVDQDYIDSLTLEKRMEQWQSRVTESSNLVALLNGKAAGFASFGPLRTPPPGTSKIRPLYSSEIYALYLKPEFFKQGIGRALLKQAVEILLAEKHQSTCLWVLEGNKRARAFYEAMGGLRVGKRMIDIGPSHLKELCYGWRDIKEILKR